MTTRLRVFVSSTMEDLGNERRTVVDRIRQLNLEPVNAEGLLPNGRSSWDVLQNEVELCHLFVLILGERYGWVPTSGFGADQKRSVTHLEVAHAQALGMPILPFFKRLRYGAASKTRDAILRDKFRNQVQDWAGGLFRAEFDWADDLGSKVGAALIDLFQDTFLKSRVRREASRVATAPPPASPPTGFEPPARDDFLQSRIAPFGLSGGKRSTLIAGAGFSLAAGYPSANALAEVLGHRAGLQASGAEILSRHRFSELAAFVEARLNRQDLLKAVMELLDTAQPVESTQAHRDSVRAFPVIVTTNYDTLFESACREQGIDFSVAASSGAPPKWDSPVIIFKSDGSASEPASLILTDQDAARVRANEAFWKAIHGHIDGKPIAIVGHSLRDTTTRWLLANRRHHPSSLYVAPRLDPLDEIALQMYGLHGLESDAERFTRALVAP